MNLKTLKDTPPWEWPEGIEKMLLDVLRDEKGAESDRLLAAEMAGDFTVINDEIAETLLSILENAEEPARLRGQAAISLGPVLEQADLEGFENPEDLPIVERTFQRIQESLRKRYLDGDVPDEVRRRILEGSARAPQDWHQEAVRAAYQSGDASWKLTGVFCMRFVPGFEKQIEEALSSGNPEIHYEAVCAAANWGVEAAWPHVCALVASAQTPKPLLLAAIDAVASIRPQEAVDILGDLTESPDEEIAEAAFEALAMAEGPPDEVDDEPRH